MAIKVWQLNVRMNQTCLDLLVHNATKFDVSIIMISDPPKSLKMGKRFQNYDVISPDVNLLEIQTSILVKKDLKKTKLFSACSRVTGVSISQKNNTYLSFLSVYIKHTSGEGLREAFDMCESLRSRGFKHVVMAGDFNAKSYRWGPHNVTSNRSGRQISEWCDANSFSVVNKFPSFPTFSGENGHISWIDLTIASDEITNECDSWKVIPLEEGLTDHNLIETMLKTDSFEERASFLKNWKDVDWLRLTLDVEVHLEKEGWLSFNWEEIKDEVELNNAIQNFSKSFLDHALHWVPERKKRRNENAWWNPEISSQHKRTKRAFRTKQKHFQSHGWIPDLLKIEANKEREKLKKMIRERKRSLWKDFTSSVTDSNMWTALRRIASKRPHLDLSFVIKENNEICDDHEQMIDILSRKFFPASNRPINPLEREELNKINLYLANAISETFPAITGAEVARQVFRGNPWSCPGPDHIPKCLLQHCFPFLQSTLVQIFNKCLKLHSHPLCWKESTVLPIPKKTGEPRISNLRPISLISSVSKLMESVMCERISYVLEDSFILDSSQFGFRKQKSVEHGLLRFQRSIEEGLRLNKVIYCCSLDVKSAFDMVSYPLLVSRAIDANLPVYMVAWINDFMSNRSALLSLPKGSRSIQVQGSTPQGSPTSPILFNLYFNKVLQIKTPNVETQGFADDLITWSIGHNEEMARDALQLHLDKLDNWMKDSILSFNTDKCYLIKFSKKINTAPPLPITISNGVLPSVDEIKYLGILFDKTLSFQSHIKEVAAKSLRKLQDLKRLATCTWGAESDILQKLCCAIIEPTIYFGSCVWSTSASRKGKLKPIEQVMRRAGIMISGAFNTISYPAVYWLSGILPPAAEIGRRLVAQSFQLEMYGLVQENWTDTQRGSLSGFVSNFDQETKYELRRIKRANNIPVFPKQTPLIARSIPPWEVDKLPKCWPGDDFLEGVDIGIILAVHKSSNQLTCVWKTSLENSEVISTAQAQTYNSLLEVSCIWKALSSAEMRRRIHADGTRRLVIVTKSQKTLQLIHSITNVQECVSNIQKYILSELAMMGIPCFWSNPKSIKMESEFKLIMEKAQLSVTTGQQRENLHWTKSHRKHWLDSVFNPRWRQMFSDSDVGRAILDLQVQFIRGQSITTVFPLERRDAALVTQFISNHFATRSYRTRFNLDIEDLIDNNSDTIDQCECGLGPETRDHLMFECPDLEFANLSSEVWKDIVCNPEAFLEFIKEVQKLLHSKNRHWGKS